MYLRNGYQISLRFPIARFLSERRPSRRHPPPLETSIDALPGSLFVNDPDAYHLHRGAHHNQTDDDQGGVHLSSAEHRPAPFLLFPTAVSTLRFRDGFEDRAGPRSGIRARADFHEFILPSSLNDLKAKLRNRYEDVDVDLVRALRWTGILILLGWLGTFPIFYEMFAH